MELNDILLVLGIFLPLLFVGIWQLNRVNPNKRAIKAGDNSIKEMYSTYNTQVQDVLKVKEAQIKSLSAKLRSYEEEPEEEEEEVSDLIKNPEIQKMLQSKGINPALLNNPLVSKYIKKYTKGMSVPEILEIANSLGIFKGSSQSQGTSQQQSQEYRTDWA